MNISEDTRRAIIDELILLGNVSGQMQIADFIAKAFPDVNEMGSSDYRFSSAVADIAQHMDRNNDWDFEHLFGPYLGLYTCEDEKFLYFLEQYVSPVIRRRTYNEDMNEVEDIDNSHIAECINKYLEREGYILKPNGYIGDKEKYKAETLNPGVKGQIKNIIFASKYKPDIVFGDALNNEIEVVNNQNQCIVYDQPIKSDGLKWKDLSSWYDDNLLWMQYDKSLEEMLRYAIGNDSPPEKIFFEVYLDLVKEVGDSIPALLPQVYLYYDPKLSKARIKRIFEHQRMDFLFVISESIRVVIEIDGKQHYADADGKASVEKYAEMVKANREMTLAGYEVYRFGGKEFSNESIAKRNVKKFLKELFAKYSIIEQ